MQTTSFFVRFYSLKDFVDLQQSNIMFYRHTEDFSPKYPFRPQGRNNAYGIAGFFADAQNDDKYKSFNKII